MDIHEILQTAGQYLYLFLYAVSAAIKSGWDALLSWILSMPLPNALKLFGNDTVNKYLFFGFAIFILVMNIWSFTLFGADKANAKRKERRIKESKLFRVCFFGGAMGGIIGMNVFHHKTLKRKFSVGIPVMFALQLVIDSFILGFLGFWTFF